MLVRVTTAVIKLHGQKQVWREGLCDSHFHARSVMGGSQELIQGRNLETGTDQQRPRRGAAHWLASPGLFNLFSYRTQDHQPRDGTTHNGLDSPPSITD